MKKENNLIFFISLFILLGIGIISFLQFQHQSNSSTKTQFTQDPTKKYCQLRSSARTCCNQKYCETASTCKPMPDECWSSEKKDTQVCRKYEWKNNSTNDCSLCSSPQMSISTLTKCGD